MDSLSNFVDKKPVRIFLVILVLGVALFLRTYQLDSVPPGLAHDEATNGLDTFDVLQGKTPILFERNNGREPLFIYLQAISVYLLGNSAFALRIVSAAIGVLTVLATYLVAREWFSYRVGLLSAAGVSVAFWHVNLSRVGLRAIALPLVLTLALLVLWKALRGWRRLHFVLAGVLVGLTQYTYIAARLVVLLIVGILLVQLIADRRAVLKQWPNIVVFLVVALVVFAPLGAYFATHLDIFFGRIEQVSLFTENPAIESKPMTLLETLPRTAGMFFVKGDAYWLHNVSGRPVFDPVAGALFVLGVAWAFRNIRRGRCQLSVVGSEESASGAQGDRLLPLAWLLLWVFIMIVPSVMAHDSPHFLRTTSMIPAVFMLAALGACIAWDWVGRAFGRVAKTGFGIFLAALVAWEGVATFNDYFNLWAGRPEVYWAFDTNLVEAIRFLSDLDGGETAYPAIFFYAYRDPTVRFLARRYYDGNWLREDTNFIHLPPDARYDAYYLLAPTAIKDLIPNHFPDVPVYYQPLAPDGSPAFTVYRVRKEKVAQLLGPQVRLDMALGDQIELVGATSDVDLSSGLAPGGSASVSLLWRLKTDNVNVYSLFVHLVDEKGRIWAQKDLLGLRKFGWHKGDVVYSRHKLEVPADAPAIPLKVVAGAMLKATGERLKPAIDQPGNVVKLFDSRVVRDGSAPPAGSDAGYAVLGGKQLIPGLEVLQSSLSTDRARIGDSLSVEPVWRLSARPSTDPVVELRLTDGKGKVYARQEAAPGYGHYPFSKWGIGEVVRDPRSVLIGGEVPPGVVHVTLAALDPGSRALLGEIDLGEVVVEDRVRSFDLPSPRYPLNASFGNQIRLLGFDLAGDPLAPGEELALTLYWQAISAPAQNYTVFTHLLDRGDVVVGQKDNPPAQGTLPTSGWVPGEVVKDEYRLLLKNTPVADELALEIGLYEPISGKRLGVDGTAEDRVILTKINVRR